MKPHSSRPGSVQAVPDPIERAHLREPGETSHVIYRYPADPEFDGLLQRFWIPVWVGADGPGGTAAGAAAPRVPPGRLRRVVRVGQVCEQFGLSERALQRLVQRRLGLTPKWLIQRRRLQEAAERLRAGDFSRATDMTPGRFAARHAPGS